MGGEVLTAFFEYHAASLQTDLRAGLSLRPLEERLRIDLERQLRARKKSVDADKSKRRMMRFAFVGAAIAFAFLVQFCARNNGRDYQASPPLSTPSEGPTKNKGSTANAEAPTRLPGPAVVFRDASVGTASHPVRTPRGSTTASSPALVNGTAVDSGISPAL